MRTKYKVVVERQDYSKKNYYKKILQKTTTMNTTTGIDNTAKTIYEMKIVLLVTYVTF